MVVNISSVRKLVKTWNAKQANENLWLLKSYGILALNSATSKNMSIFQNCIDLTQKKEESAQKKWSFLMNWRNKSCDIGSFRYQKRYFKKILIESIVPKIDYSDSFLKMFRNFSNPRKPWRIRCCNYMKNIFTFQ